MPRKPGKGLWCQGLAWLFPSAKGLLRISVGNQKSDSIGLWEVELAGVNLSDMDQGWTGTGKVLDDQ